MVEQICGIKLVRKNSVFIALLALVLTVLISFYYQNIVLEQVQYFRYKWHTNKFLIGNKTVMPTRCNCFIANTPLSVSTKLTLCNHEEFRNKAGRSYANWNFLWALLF